MTRQQAIEAKCKDCIYDPCEEGTWRQQAERCELMDCALWPYRPKSRSKRPHLADSGSVQPHYEGNRGQVIAEGLQQRDQCECMWMGDL
jgi:hypothetical protein